MARAWRLVVARAKRQLGLDKIDYLAVFEATKRGEPHLHILCRCGFIPQRWLSEQMRQIMASPIVDIRLIRSTGQAARYIAKYVGKEPHHFATCKRFWHTQRWVVVERPAHQGHSFRGRGWVVEQKSLADVFTAWTLQRKHPTIIMDHTNRPGIGLLPDIVAWGSGTAPAASQPAASEAVTRCLLHIGSRA